MYTDNYFVKNAKAEIDWNVVHGVAKSQARPSD